MKKKWMIRVAVLIGTLMAALLVAAPAMAMWDWCDVDPTLTIGWHNVSIQASIQGDPTLIRGNIVFTVNVPKGTQVKLVSSDPGAQVKVNYTNSDENNYGDNSNGNGRNDHGNGGSYHGSSKGIPVDVSVDINSWTMFKTKVVVYVDGNLVAQDTATTTRGDLDCQFTIK